METSPSRHRFRRMPCVPDESDVAHPIAIVHGDDQPALFPPIMIQLFAPAAASHASRVNAKRSGDGDAPRGSLNRQSSAWRLLREEGGVTAGSGYGVAESGWVPSAARSDRPDRLGPRGGSALPPTPNFRLLRHEGGGNPNATFISKGSLVSASPEGNVTCDVWMAGVVLSGFA
jgi:hypothetical protein